MSEDKKENFIKKVSDSFTEKLNNVLDWTKSNDGTLVKGSIASLATTLGMYEPVMGVCTAFFMELYDPIKRKVFVDEIQKTVKNLEQERDSLNFEFIMSEKGQKILREFIHETINEIDQRKRDHLRSFLVNSYTKQNLDKIMMDDYWETLISLNPVDLQILKNIYEPEDFFYHIITKSEGNFDKKDWMKIELEYFLDLDRFVVNRSFTKLKNKDIIDSPSEKHSDTMRELIMTYKGRIKDKEELLTRREEIQHYLLTDFGKNFIEFCKQPPQQNGN